MSRVIEADDSGALVIPPDVLGSASPRARYIVERDGRRIRIEPEGGSPLPSGQSSAQWLKEWAELAQRIGAASTAPVSAVELLSEMRR